MEWWVIFIIISAVPFLLFVIILCVQFIRKHYLHGESADDVATSGNFIDRSSQIPNGSYNVATNLQNARPTWLTLPTDALPPPNSPPPYEALESPPPTYNTLLQLPTPWTVLSSCHQYTTVSFNTRRHLSVIPLTGNAGHTEETVKVILSHFDYITLEIWWWSNTFLLITSLVTWSSTCISPLILGLLRRVPYRRCHLSACYCTTLRHRNLPINLMSFQHSLNFFNS